MKVYGYIRVSTDRQDYENQQYLIAGETSEPVEYFMETVSGKVSWKQRRLAILIDTLNPDDILIVAELSRLGRSLLEVMELLSVLVRKRVRVHSIREKLWLADDIQSKVIAFAFSLGAEIERQLISQRTKEALRYKKSLGKLPTRGKDKTKRTRRCKNESNY